MRLSRDDFLKAEDRHAEEVDLSDIPGYNGSMLIRGLTGTERDEFEASLFQKRGNNLEPNPRNVRAKLVARCCVDDDGKQLFDIAEVELIGKKSGQAISRLYNVAARLSGLSESDVEEMARDFGKGAGSGSSSALPESSI